MSIGNGRPCSQVPRLPWPKEEQRVAQLCKALGMPEPILAFSIAPGTTGHAWPGDDVIVLLATGSARHDARRVNACSTPGWRPLLVSRGDWESGTGLALVRRALDEG
jgi:hypothetical protein